MPLGSALTVLAAAAAAAGCTGDPPSRSGADVEPITLTATSYEPQGRAAAAALAEFAHRAAAFSDGAIRITLGPDPDSSRPDTSADKIAEIRKGTYDLGIVATRSFDRLGVSTFQALQAPFLVSSNELGDRILADEITDEMLDGLDEIGLRGLALTYADRRFPIGYKTPLRSREDYRGKTVAARPSDATYALLRALGATPSPINGAELSTAAANGSVGGSEGVLGQNYPVEPAIITANEQLYFKANALVVNKTLFDGLSNAQQNVLRRAARATREWAARQHPDDATAVRLYCADAHGAVVLATNEQLASLRAAARPILDEMQHDPFTKRAIMRIRKLERESTPPTLTPCTSSAKNAPATTKAVAGGHSMIDGVWRVNVEAESMLGHPGFSQADAYANAGTWTFTFDDGSYSYAEPNGRRTCSGTYVINGDVIVMRESGPAGGCDGVWTASLQLTGDTLRLGAPPADPDSWIGAFLANPLHRIGLTPRSGQSALDGTWRLEVRREDLAAAGAPVAFIGANSGVWTFRLKDGKGTIDQPEGDPCIVSYAIDGEKIELNFGAEPASGCSGLMHGTFKVAGSTAVFMWETDEGSDPVAWDNAFFKHGLHRIAGAP